MAMKIDSHQHYWLISRTDYGWLTPASGLLYADFMPEHLKPLMAQFGIDKTVVVQAAPSAAETEFLLGIAANEATVAGVVGWLDLTASDFRRQWEHFHRNPKFVGIRPTIQDLPSEWILQDVVVSNLAFLAQRGFTVDLQSNPRHLPYLVQLMERVPTLKAVVDHLATPAYHSRILQPWAGYMSQLAAYPNVMCKLSGMVYGSNNPGWSPQAVKLFADHVIGAFGKRRVMFGADWPVCLKYATYQGVLQLMDTILGLDWAQQERDDVYGGNATRFYGLHL
ncbi:MAG: amidohydrolase family protein [Chloroflexi bacterium]|nr:amidohydrolase family protein [Chloroflexota bacterium]MCL5275450.1 amidohydrolase family protein [Chloroflexota bacterium]